MKGSEWVWFFLSKVEFAYTRAQRLSFNACKKKEPWNILKLGFGKETITWPSKKTDPGLMLKMIKKNFGPGSSAQLIIDTLLNHAVLLGLSSRF